jgi:hypothetical protein
MPGSEGGGWKRAQKSNALTAYPTPVGTPRDFLLVAGPRCREAAAIVGATVAL